MKGYDPRMTQLSIDNLSFSIPKTYEDIDAILTQIREDETDQDLFSFNETKSGRSYSFYGTKVFEFIPKGNSSRIKVSSDIALALGKPIKQNSNQTFVQISLNSSEDIESLVDALKEKKRALFRSINTFYFYTQALNPLC